MTSLVDPEWAQQLINDPETVIVLNATDLVLGKTALTPDHMFTAFLRTNLLVDLLALYRPSHKETVSLFHLGTDVCGHPEIVHGGMTSAMIDESFGVLVYMLKRDQQVGPGRAFTAHLEVDFRKPIPAGIGVLCRCWLDNVAGRKIWVRAEVRDSPQGTVFAEGKALFVSSKDTAAADPLTAIGAHPAVNKAADAVDGEARVAVGMA